MKKSLILYLLLFAITCNPRNSFAQTTPVEIEARTFILSNEAPGYLIDNLIAAGYRDSSLYAVIHYLQPLSGGVIPQWFMDSLAVCPVGSDVFTAKLSNFAGLNNPVGIAEDGTLIIAAIYGRDYSVKEGYTTYNDTLVPLSLKLFTKAIGPEYYINAGEINETGKGNYQAFGIAWSMEPPTTFVLSNEGGLIDDLIRAGHGDKNLFQTLELLQPNSGGAIPQWFMDKLAVFPPESEIFSTHLTDYTGFNNPVCINTDNSIRIQPILGQNYLIKDGYTTIPLNQGGYTSELFTVANSAESYIDAGSSGTSGGTQIFYKAFAIAWKASTTFVLTNEGGLIDDLIRAGHGTKNLYQTLEVLKPKSGGVISDEFMATLANCPAGSEIFTAVLNTFAGFNNPVCVNTDGTLKIKPIFAKDYFSMDGYTTLPLNQNGYTPELFTYANSSENYMDAGEGPGQSRYKAFAIAWKASTTFVLTNEGGLIDDLIRAGHGNKNLYQTLEILKPKSGGVISDEFMATLANCPAGSDIFTAALSNFAGLNNPVCINSDGTMSIQPIYGKDLFQKEGYTTLPLNQGGYTSAVFTVANSAENYVNAGEMDDILQTTYYKAFAIAWKASTTFVLTNEGGLIDDLIRAGHGDKNLYQTLEILKPKSGGVISDEFMATLANCPAGSDIFTAALSNFAGLNNPVCVSTDGTLSIQPIFGRTYLLKDGYTTLPLNQKGYTPELFTYANSAGKYIDAGEINETGEGNYQAFAIAWKASTTFVLTNEGGLIDDLIHAGNGDKNLYQTLEILKPKSGGVISDDFMATLANCPKEREIFSTQLNNYTGLNNPVCINTDGTCNILGIFGKDYYQKTGYYTWPEQSSSQTELFTVSNDFNSLIEAGFWEPYYYYKAFAIAWSNKPVGISITETGTETPSVYPNPTTGKFKVEGLKFNVQRVEVVDLNGKMLENFKPQQAHSEMSFDIGHLPPGVYVIKIFTQNSIYSRLIVLK